MTEKRSKSGEKRFQLNMDVFDHVRIAGKLKIYQIAERIGWHAGTLSNVLVQARRQEPISISQIAAIAWALDRRPQDLIKGSFEASTPSWGNSSQCGRRGSGPENEASWV